MKKYTTTKIFLTIVIFIHVHTMWIFQLRWKSGSNASAKDNGCTRGSVDWTEKVIATPCTCDSYNVLGYYSPRTCRVYWMRSIWSQSYQSMLVIMRCAKACVRETGSEGTHMHLQGLTCAVIWLVWQFKYITKCSRLTVTVVWQCSNCLGADVGCWCRFIKMHCVLGSSPGMT